MPRKRNETNQQWMERLQRTRAEMESGKFMERTRAAVGYCNADHSNAEHLKMSAFLDLFHPELSDDKRRELVADARRQGKS